MPNLYDYRCSVCGNVEEHAATPEERELPCSDCGATATRVWLTAPRPHWLALAQGASASPEAIDRFDRMHRQQMDKEDRCYAEHGDYGPAPGAD
jgi:putative FmdB family regulatory protein